MCDGDVPAATPLQTTPTEQESQQRHRRRRIMRRILGSVLDVLSPAGFVSSSSSTRMSSMEKDETTYMTTTTLVVHTAGPLRFIPKPIKKLHDPIFYFVAGLVAGMRYNWCFQNPIFLACMAFCIKWYRARYVFKIPVWDRQPNWNNIITEKSQEKHLRALTCKNCGTTLFIAKTREFFFEGNTGLGGLGCFHCGAKGKDNFVMDRDRIVEDVGDMDDYFEYERPLDLVSRAERRKLLQQAAGDEEKANQLLINRTGAGGGGANGAAAASTSSPPLPLDFIDAEVNMAANDVPQEAPKKKKKKKKKKSVTTTTTEETAEPTMTEPPTDLVDTTSSENDIDLSGKKKQLAVSTTTKTAVTASAAKRNSSSTPNQPPPAARAYSNANDDDDLSALDMDGW